LAAWVNGGGELATSVMAILAVLSTSCVGLLAIIHFLFPRRSGATTGPLKPAAITMATVSRALEELGNADVDARLQGISDVTALKIDTLSPTDRAQILNGIAMLIRAELGDAPEDNSASCGETGQRDVSNVAAEALTLIGHRQDPEHNPVDLAAVNLSFVVFPAGDYAGVIFDRSLLCRATLNGSTFANASFENADLREVAMDKISVTAKEFSDVLTLCNTGLPAGLIGDGAIQKLHDFEPHSHTRCRVDP
jgi:uncharacterized protein YjbI with pentapeptide repeats